MSSTTLDPLPAIDQIGKRASNELRELRATVQREREELSARLESLIASFTSAIRGVALEVNRESDGLFGRMDSLQTAINASTKDARDEVESFTNRMGSITASIIAIQSDVAASSPVPSQIDDNPIPGFLSKALPPGKGIPTLVPHQPQQPKGGNGPRDKLAIPAPRE